MYDEPYYLAWAGEVGSPLMDLFFLSIASVGYGLAEQWKQEKNFDQKIYWYIAIIGSVLTCILLRHTFIPYFFLAGVLFFIIKEIVKKNRIKN